MEVTAPVVRVLAVGDDSSFAVPLDAAARASGIASVSSIESDKLTKEERTVSAWREKIRPYDRILYSGRRIDGEECRTLRSACLAESKLWFAAVCDGASGEAAGHLLANVLAANLSASLGAEADPAAKDRCFVLDMEKLEGTYLSLWPGSPEEIEITTEPVHRLSRYLSENRGPRLNPDEWHSLFSGLTGPRSGILRIWDEGDLVQLPLSQCRVQTVDPLSDRSSGLLPSLVRSGATHREARMDAGLAGIEAYASRLSLHASPPLADPVAVGAGTTADEAVYRGLLACLARERSNRDGNRRPIVRPASIARMEDSRCRYYWRALTTMQGIPAVGRGEDLLGFPVVWVGVGETWHAGVNLNLALALRTALQLALLRVQNPSESFVSPVQAEPVPEVFAREPAKLDVQPFEYGTFRKPISDAVRLLKRHRTRMSVRGLKLAPVLNEFRGELCLVGLRKEASADE